MGVYCYIGLLSYQRGDHKMCHKGFHRGCYVGYCKDPVRPLRLLRWVVFCFGISTVLEGFEF